MAIGNAVQRSGTVYVYNEKGHQICAIGAGSGPNDGLRGYTSSTVNIQKSNTIYTYNEKGHQIGAVAAR